MRYRKKPVVIEAIQWTGENYEQIAEFAYKEIFSICKSKVEIVTLEGVMTASVGDYIIKGVHGEFYPCKPDIFLKTYDKVD